MSFFKNFLKKNKPKTKTTLEFSSNKINDFVFSFVDQDINLLKDFSAKKFSQIKYLIETISVSAKNLDSLELVEQPNLSRYFNPAKTAKKNLSRKLPALISSLVPPNNFDPIIIRNYSNTSYVFLNQEVSIYRKNIVLVANFLKPEMRALGEKITELVDCFKEINDFFSAHNKVFSAYSISNQAKDLDILIQEYNSLLDKYYSSSKEVSNVIKSKFVIEKQISSIEKSDEAKKFDIFKDELKSLLEEKRELKTRLITLFSSIERPLRKFENLVSSNKATIAPEYKSLLLEYGSDPISALKKDKNQIILRFLLGELRIALLNGLIEMEQKELEKRISSIDELLNFNYFSDPISKLISTEFRIDTINKELSSCSSPADLLDHRSRLSSISKQVDSASSILNSIESTILSKQQNISSLKNSLEHSLSSFSSSEVSIDFELRELSSIQNSSNNSSKKNIKILSIEDKNNLINSSNEE